VGRTARAGRKGLVINLVTDRDAPFMAKLATIKGLPAPSARDLH
jgi:superfamily II DNA/RNA helicase